jgi:hypothetical protein
MPGMKNLWAHLLAVCSVAATSIIVTNHFAPDSLASKSSYTVVQSYSFLPGQSMDFPNKKFHRVEVRSTFPVRVLTGPCHEENVVQFFCKSDPGDIFITDLRGKPFLRTPEANQITITEIKK